MTDCIEWTRTRDSQGYGRVYDRTTRKIVGAHRLAWQKANGPIPEGMLIMHECDNPPCINIDHLKIGTWADNNRDCRNKGRNSGGAPKGEKHGKAKLTEAQVLEIRSLLKQAVPKTRIAAQFSVSPMAIKKIDTGHTWGSLMPNIVELLQAEIEALAGELSRGEKHKCRNCLFYSCGGTGACKCSCGWIRKEQARHMERLRHLVECVETGEVPAEVSEHTQPATYPGSDPT